MFSVKVPYLFVFSEWFCTERRFSWTEDNRLEAVLDNNMGAFYSYDAAGERHYKLTGATVSVSQNGNSVNAPVFDRQTLYASPLITITDKGYTKHYFEEGNRICSSIGSGGFSNIFQHTSPIVSDLKEINRKTNQNAINTYKNNIGVTPYINVTSIYPYIFYHRSTLYKSAPEAVFYYHTDHLGSATLVTDDDADVVQQIAYLPYGEDWVDIRHHGYFGSAYKFNGKEKDDETGYSYYGARYYTDRLSIWLSVDPLADKYPHLSPYAYCADNPMKYIDPTGEFPIETIWDIVKVLYDVGAAVVNYIKGDHQAAKANLVDLGLDAGAMLIPYVPVGTSKVLKVGAAGAKALDKATDAGRAARMTENAAKGKAFEKQVGESLGKNKASQVTIEAADGTRTKVDFVQKMKEK